MSSLRLHRFLLVALVPLALLVPSAGAVPTELFFSEYIEGSSNNKALEISNGTGAPMTLTDTYDVQMCFNGNTLCTLTIPLVGTVAAGDVFVLAQASANAAILAEADQTNASGWFNGDDAVLLRKGTVVIDSIGQRGSDPGAERGTALTSTADNTLGERLPSRPATRSTTTRSIRRSNGTGSRPTPSTGSAAPVRPAVRRHHRHRHLSVSAATAPIVDPRHPGLGSGEPARGEHASDRGCRRRRLAGRERPQRLLRAGGGRGGGYRRADVGGNLRVPSQRARVRPW